MLVEILYNELYGIQIRLIRNFAKRNGTNLSGQKEDAIVQLNLSEKFTSSNKFYIYKKTFSANLLLAPEDDSECRNIVPILT